MSIEHDWYGDVAEGPKSSEKKSGKPVVFISYAHADDEPFVKRLRDDLVEKGYEVWRDRESMPSRGLSFLREISDAIVSEIDKVVLIVGPHAIASKYVQLEWGTALEFCKVVIPVLREGDYKDLPPEISYVDVVDARDSEQYEETLNEIEFHLNLDDRLGEFFGVPGHLLDPEHSIIRSDKMQELYDILLDDAKIPKVKLHETLSIVGDGGSGKSTLAAQIATHCEFQRAFHGGVYWIECPNEKEPEEKKKAFEEVLRNMLFNILSFLGRTFSIEDLNALNENTIKSKIRSYTKENPCLIVIDNAWSAEDIRFFQDLIGRTRTRILVTTRERLEAAKVGKTYDLDLFTDEESERLLASRSKYSEENSSEEVERAIHIVLRNCGNLPMALQVAGGYINGNPRMWTTLATFLEEGDFTRLNQTFHDDPNFDLFKLTQVSAERLYDETQILYADLAVFPKDKPIPISFIYALWTREGYREEEIENFIFQMVNSSLAHYGEDDSLILHDLQWDYVRGVTENLSELHARIVESYRNECGGRWHEIEDDGYFYHNILRHVLMAKDFKTLEEIIFDIGWIKKRFALEREFPSYRAEYLSPIFECGEPTDFEQRITEPTRLMFTALNRLEIEFQNEGVNFNFDKSFSTILKNNKFERLRIALEERGFYPEFEDQEDESADDLHIDLLCEEGKFVESHSYSKDGMSSIVKDSDSIIISNLLSNTNDRFDAIGVSDPILSSDGEVLFFIDRNQKYIGRFRTDKKILDAALEVPAKTLSMSPDEKFLFVTTEGEEWIIIQAERGTVKYGGWKIVPVKKVEHETGYEVLQTNIQFSQDLKNNYLGILSKNRLEVARFDGEAFYLNVSMNFRDQSTCIADACAPMLSFLIGFSNGNVLLSEMSNRGANNFKFHKHNHGITTISSEDLGMEVVVVSGDENGGIRFSWFDKSGQASLRDIELPSSHSSPITAIAVDRLHRVITTNGRNGSIKMWSLDEIIKRYLVTN